MRNNIMRFILSTLMGVFGLVLVLPFLGELLNPLVLFVFTSKRIAALVGAIAIIIAIVIFFAFKSGEADGEEEDTEEEQVVEETPARPYTDPKDKVIDPLAESAVKKATQDKKAYDWQKDEH